MYNDRYHIETTFENNLKYLCVTFIILGKKHFIEKHLALHP